jgi:hypothetical protein
MTDSEYEGKERTCYKCTELSCCGAQFAATKAEGSCGEACLDGTVSSQIVILGHTSLSSSCLRD